MSVNDNTVVERCQHSAGTFLTTEDDSISSTQSLANLMDSSSGCMKVTSQAYSLELEYGTKKPKCPKKVVRWGQVTIHSHAPELGDNPAVSSGPPLTIGWKAFESCMVDLEDYEALRPPAREKAEMLLPKVVREDRLRTAGYARGELKEAEERVRQVKDQRSKSATDGNILVKLSAMCGLNKFRGGRGLCRNGILVM